MKKRLPLIYWFGVVFCFFIFPVFLLEIGIDSYIKTSDKRAEVETYKKLELNLEKIIQYGDSRHYYHSLLKRVFDIAESQKDTILYLNKAIPHLKKRNPGVFSFILWDNETQALNTDLSDEKGHKYALKTLRETFFELYKSNLTNYPVVPERKDFVTKKLNVLRAYIGNLLVAESLNLPLLRANLGRVIPVSAKSDKAFFWFQSGKKITMVAFIDKRAMDTYSYVDKLIDGLNKNSDKNIKFGMIDLLNNREIIPETDEKSISELRLGLIKYDNYSNQKIVTNNYIMLIKILNPYMRAFTYIEKAKVYKPEGLLEKSLTLVIGIILLAFTCGWLFYKYTPYNISMRWKLLFLFLYSNGLPLVGLTFVGYDYLQQNKETQLQEVHDHISLMLNDFDARFDKIKKEYAASINDIINSINAVYGDMEKTKPLYEELKRKVEPTNYSDFLVMNKEGKIILSGEHQANTFTWREVFANLINFMNNEIYTPSKTFNVKKDDSDSLGALYKGGVFFSDIVSKLGTIFSEQIVDNFNYYYFNTIGDVENRNFNEMITISWPVSQLQENYVNKNIEKLNENNKNIRFVAFSENNGKILPENNRETAELVNRFRQILNLKLVKLDETFIDGKSYVAFGSVGMKLDKIALIGLYPSSIINSNIDKIRYKLIGFALIVLLLTLSISKLLCKYFLLPLNDLQTGIEALGSQNFSYRLPIKTADEFGNLNKAFNESFESLEDLAVAKIVQENLFPLQPLHQNNCFVWGKSVTMTQLGGDYFDYFPISQNEVGILMGDVAGHGIPAGFLMAMAKASVLLSGDEKASPSKLLLSIHKVFNHVKNKKIIRMMTCVYFSINSETGAYKVVNAGHCYPIIINKKGEASYIEINARPLGIGKRPGYFDIEGQLEKDSFLLLYTDGVLEARNSSGEMMGLERFLKLASSSFSIDPKTYYARLFKGYKDWSLSADDDITMVLVRFGFKEET